jgi:hypothetical protein
MRVVDADAVEWRPGSTEGLTFSCQVLLDGAEGGPEALRFRFDPTPSVYAHMHLTAQFQLMLGGRIHMPRRRLDLGPLDVHYTDHNVPYGPFSVSEGHDMLVLHPKAGGLMPMSYVDARRSINLPGRLVVGSADAIEWEGSNGAGIRLKELVPAHLGPEVVLLDFEPGVGVAFAPPAYGRYEVVIDGHAVMGGRPLGRASFRYIEPNEASDPLVAGPEGAQVMILSFDADAREGGLTDEGLAVLAKQELARAI